MSRTVTALFFLLVLLAVPLGSRAADAAPPGRVLVRLDDVQGLWGGQDLVLEDNGNVFVRTVRRGEEKQHYLKLTAAEVKTLIAFIPGSGIQDYRERKRDGVADEARPKITVTLPKQKKIVAAKWANDADPNFDKLYRKLLDLVKQASQTPP